MEELEFDKAHEIYNALWKSISVHVAERLTALSMQQREYVLDKLHDEYRFWNVWDCIEAIEALPLIEGEKE